MQEFLKDFIVVKLFGKRANREALTNVCRLGGWVLERFVVQGRRRQFQRVAMSGIVICYVDVPVPHTTEN